MRRIRETEVEAQGARREKMDQNTGSTKRMAVGERLISFAGLSPHDDDYTDYDDDCLMKRQRLAIIMLLLNCD